MPRRSRQLFASALLALLAMSCKSPDDVLFTPPIITPVEIQPGVFRVTWNLESDVVRGFTPTGDHITYRTRGLPGLGGEWRVLSAPTEGGPVREAAGLYRTALRDPVGNVMVQPDRRVMTVWVQGIADGGHSCGGLCPVPPTVVGLGVLRLDTDDGAPLASLPTRGVTLPNHVSSDPCSHRIRFRPTETEMQARGVNPFGPAIGPESSVGFYSDGESVWQFDLDDPSAPADSLGPGVFPSLAPDGSLLAVATPLGLDSTTDTQLCTLCCVQQTVTITATGWDVLVYDLEAETSWTLTSGLEPEFHPDGDRLLVRKVDALYWVTLATGAEELIAGTNGGYAPAISPDGSTIAFSSSRFGNPDVFFVRLE